MFAGKKSAQIREILISESAWEEMTCLFAPSLAPVRVSHPLNLILISDTEIKNTPFRRKTFISPGDILNPINQVTNILLRENGYSDLAPDFNHRLNQGEIMKRWFLLLPILSYSCFTVAGADLAGSEFSVLSRLTRGHDMVAMTGQQGSSNNSTINQSGSRTVGIVSQNGRSNSVLLNQLGSNNLAAISQYGRGNNASVAQNGTDNKVYLVQAGIGNDAEITQSGFDNTAVVIDKGRHNLTQINQTGTSRNAGVVQNSAGMAIRITQN